MTIGVIIQARMTSRRFPGKVMTLLMGKPVLMHVIDACRRASVPDMVAVACPIGEKSEPIRRLCMDLRIRCMEGAEHDVLARYMSVANSLKLSTIIRVTGDCPFLNHQLIDEVALALSENKLDYASNVYPRRTYPKGWDVEAFTDTCLRHTNIRARSRYDREHVTPYMQRSDDLRKGSIYQDSPLSHLNLCVDYPSDINRLENLLDGPMAWRMGRCLPRTQSLH